MGDSRLGHQTPASKAGRWQQGHGERKSESCEALTAQTGVVTSTAADYPRQAHLTVSSRQPAQFLRPLLSANGQFSPVLLDPRCFFHHRPQNPATEHLRTAWGIRQSVNTSRDA